MLKSLSSIIVFLHKCRETNCVFLGLNDVKQPFKKQEVALSGFFCMKRKRQKSSGVESPASPVGLRRGLFRARAKNGGEGFEPPTLPARVGAHALTPRGDELVGGEGFEPPALSV
jgi:hypothetical protein